MRYNGSELAAQVGAGSKCPSGQLHPGELRRATAVRPACAMLASVRFLRGAGFLLILAISSSPAHVVRVEVASRQEVLNGQTFGTAGAYERITGRVYFSI